MNKSSAKWYNTDYTLKNSHVKITKYKMFTLQNIKHETPGKNNKCDTVYCCIPYFHQEAEIWRQGLGASVQTWVCVVEMFAVFLDDSFLTQRQCGMHRTPFWNTHQHKHQWSLCYNCIINSKSNDSDTQARFLNKLTCTRNLHVCLAFFYKFPAANRTQLYSTQESCTQVTKTDRPDWLAA